ncbi:adenosine deaminase [Loktanella sp. SALINAS62]|uniref:adenosine deaminase n=1 Tax=Loktanella sp. SALINAS62 TaxID=2706124 RepID=UPI001B8A92FB|nr:adenosine deaminase [Loktanella sp. SALINAS62]MBS1303345.1 adenosine deaminase [Loktanella sp. SALINAS62]
MNFRSQPKVELHTHIEGMAPPDFIRDLAREKRVNLSAIFDPDGGYVFRDFAHFLSVYDQACTVLTGPEEFYRLTRAVLAESAFHGVIYTETFLSPDFCGGGDVVAWRDYLAAIAQAASDAERDDGIVLRGIATAVRHHGRDACRKAARCAAETAGPFLTGFGLAGAELDGRPADFTYSFDMAREAGLQLTAHAGEWGDPGRIRETLDALGVARLGHGIRAIEDPALVALLAERGITLEVCPGSNVVLRAVDSWDDHPIAKLREAGVPITVSTDDPPFFHTTMTAEYENLSRTFGWGHDDFLAMNKAGIAAAFCDSDTKDAILKRLEPAT